MMAIGTQTFGFLQHSSSFRWTSTLLPPHSTFTISIRENHLVGDQLSLHQVETAAAGKTDSLIHNGRAANTFREDYVECLLEFDLDNLEDLRLRSCTANDKHLIRKYHPAASNAASDYGVIMFRSCERPSFRKLQSEFFSNGSVEADSVNVLRSVTSFKILLFMPQHSSYAKAFAAFRDKCFASRTFGTGPTSRNNWYQAGFEFLCTDTFNVFEKYINQDHIRFPVQHWLKDSIETELVGTVYPKQPGKVPRARFTTANSYYSHYTPVLLHERDGSILQQRKLYNSSNVFPAVAVQTGPDSFALSLKISGDGVVFGSEESVPQIVSPARTSIVLCRPGHLDSDDEL